MNYTEEQIPYTRIIEHKHFETNNHDHSIITKEYPQEWSRDKLKIYPINTQKNNNLYNEYACRIDPDKYIIGGRLAEYKYYDMHQVIGSSLKKSIKEFTWLTSISKTALSAFAAIDSSIVNQDVVRFIMDWTKDALAANSSVNDE